MPIKTWYVRFSIRRILVQCVKVKMTLASYHKIPEGSGKPATRIHNRKMCATSQGDKPQHSNNYLDSKVKLLMCPKTLIYFIMPQLP